MGELRGRSRETLAGILQGESDDRANFQSSQHAQLSVSTSIFPRRPSGAAAILPVPVARATGYITPPLTGAIGKKHHFNSRVASLPLAHPLQLRRRPVTRR